MDVVLMVGVVISIGLGASSFLIARKNQNLLQQVIGEDSEYNFEEALTAQIEGMQALNKQITTIDQKLLLLAGKISLAPQKVSIVRFNPFGDTGGDQSFALAVLDEHDSGYVLSSIHGRGGTRVYVKPIDLGKSKYQLSEEESRAIKQAKQRIPK